MARKRKKRTLKPRVPSRVRKTKKDKKRASGLRHPELIGLGLVALGIFLAAVMYANWNGGYVGGWIARGLHVLVGASSYALPVVFAVVGTLMVGRSALLDVRPFRTGLLVFSVGLLLVLGAAHGGAFGHGLEWGFAKLLGHGGATILGVTAMVIGGILLWGASLGAVLRRSGAAVKNVGDA